MSAKSIYKIRLLKFLTTILTTIKRTKIHFDEVPNKILVDTAHYTMTMIYRLKSKFITITKVKTIPSKALSILLIQTYHLVIAIKYYVIIELIKSSFDFI